MTTRIPVLFAILGCSLVAAGAALSHQGATGIVKERMEMMKDIGAAMKALAPMVRGQAAWDAGLVGRSAAVIASHARDLPEKFPEGSGGHPSEAGATIWRDWEGFVAEARALRAYAMALEAVAGEGPEAAQPTFLDIAGTCRSCHEAYRVKQ